MLIVSIKINSCHRKFLRLIICYTTKRPKNKLSVWINFLKILYIIENNGLLKQKDQKLLGWKEWCITKGTCIILQKNISSLQMCVALQTIESHFHYANLCGIRSFWLTLIDCPTWGLIDISLPLCSDTFNHLPCLKKNVPIEYIQRLYSDNIGWIARVFFDWFHKMIAFLKMLY